QFLQPGIVGVRAIADGDWLVQMQLVGLGRPTGGGVQLRASDTRSGRAPFGRERLLRYRAWRYREDAVVQAVIPELVERPIARLVPEPRVLPYPPQRP